MPNRIPPRLDPTAACSAAEPMAPWAHECLLSEDLREKIVRALHRGMGKSETARTFSVSLSSVKRYAKMADEGRPLAPKKRPGSKPKVGEDAKRGCWRHTWRNARRQRYPKGASTCGGS